MITLPDGTTAPNAMAWRRNLHAIWCAELVAMAGCTVIVPIIPLYVWKLGVQTEAEARIWAGVIFAALCPDYCPRQRPCSLYHGADHRGRCGSRCGGRCGVTDRAFPVRRWYVRPGRCCLCRPGAQAFSPVNESLDNRGEDR